MSNINNEFIDSITELSLKLNREVKHDFSLIEIMHNIYSGTYTCEDIARYKALIAEPRIEYQMNLIEQSMVNIERTNSNRLYYYVDLNVFINNIVEKNNSADQKISILAGHCNYMNDREEFNIGYNVVKKNKILDKSIIENIDRYKEEQPFIICFSQVCDYLPMWHIYAQNAGGVILCFDMDKIFHYKIGQMKKVIYDNTEEYAAFFDLIVNTERYLTHNEAEQNEKTLNKALEWFPFIAKNRSFDYEKEIRLTRIGWDDLMPDKNHIYINKQGVLCPYRKVYFPADFLKEIYLSPIASNNQTEYSLRKFLNQNGLKEVDIVRSKIPYRG